MSHCKDSLELHLKTNVFVQSLRFAFHEVSYIVKSKIHAIVPELNR